MSDRTPKADVADVAAAAAPQPDPQQIIFQLATGYIPAAAIQTVVKLGVPDQLAGGPRAVADLAAAAAVNEDALYRVMRALAGLGVFAETAPRTFALTPAGEMLQRGRLREMALWISSPFHFRVYSNMLDAVRTGTPAAEKTVGMPVFEYLAKDTELSAIFNDAMTGFSASVVAAILEAYDFSGIGVLVDVAGGHGALLTAVLQQYPAMRGILMDVDHVIEGAKPRIRAQHLEGRCEAVAGDFFNAVPAGGDAYMMKHIIHDWDDERASRILKNVQRELRGKSGGKVILLETVIQPGNAPDLGKLMDLEMLMMPGGRERTEAEFRTLLAASGFELTRIVPTKSPLSVIEGRPAKA
jgi:hypothetical protein